METIGKVFQRAERAEARVKELEDFLDHEEHTYKYHDSWWENRLAIWTRKIEEGNDE